MVAILLGADNGFFYAGQIMHFSSPFTVFLIYHKQALANDRGVLYAHVHVQLCYPIPCSLYGTEYRCAAQTGQE